MQVINFFAGPGAGKSTLAAYVFASLKRLGYSCEYVSEAAKDAVWEENHTALRCQPYITANQLYRQFRLIGKVDYVITDSPLPLGIVYKDTFCDTNWVNSVMWQFNQFDNLNFFVDRGDSLDYSSKGRLHSLAEARLADEFIIKLLNQYDVAFTKVTQASLDTMLAIVLDQMHHTSKNKAWDSMRIWNNV